MNPLVRSINTKDLMKQKYQQNPTLYKIEFLNYRNSLNHLLKIAKTNYVNNKMHDLKFPKKIIAIRDSYFSDYIREIAYNLN